MIFYFRISFVSLLVIVFTTQLNAQQLKEEIAVNKNAISVTIQPFYLLKNAAKIDIEFQKSGRNFAYILSPEVYAGNVRDATTLSSIRNENTDKINGFGIGLLQKYKKKDKIGGPYLAYGVTYRYQTIDYESEDFKQFEEDGFTFYEYEPIKDVLKINSFLFSGTFGFQKVKRDFVYDLYTGFGYKKPSIKSTYPEARKYNQGFNSYAYDGVVFLLGFKMGYQIKK